MGVDVIHVGGLQAGLFKGQTHRHHSACATGIGTCQVVGVAGEAAASHFCINLCSACHGVLVILKNQHTGSFCHHEAVAALVKRTGGSGRVIVAGRKGAHRVETAHAGIPDRGFGAAHNHCVGTAGLNQLGSDSDGYRAGRAGSREGEVGTAEAVLDGNLAGGDVGNDFRDKERTISRPFSRVIVLSFP